MTIKEVTMYELESGRLYATLVEAQNALRDEALQKLINKELGTRREFDCDELAERTRALSQLEAGKWDEKRLREFAKEKGWYVREGASVPDIHRGGYKHPFSITAESSAVIDLLNALLASPSPAPEAEPEKLGRFGHHPDPAIDYCIEVEAIEGYYFDATHGIGKPSEGPRKIDDTFRNRVERALDFIVGGDLNAIAAKSIVRRVHAELATPTPAVDADAVIEALKTVLASLVATTSLIIRAEDMKVKPSKAVASDAMFLQMLKDYDNATFAGRAALSLPPSANQPKEKDE